jgi:hypothetical protein
MTQEVNFLMISHSCDYSFYLASGLSELPHAASDGIKLLTEEVYKRRNRRKLPANDCQQEDESCP